MYPEALLLRLKQRIPRQWRICFLSALAVGLAAHLYRLTNWLPNWDSLVFRYDASSMTQFGRCFLGLANGISSYYELPWLCGLLSLLYIGLAAVCVCALFSVQTSMTAALVGSLMAAFPTVTSTMTYLYTADGYCMALLCVCLASLLLARGGKCCIPAVALLSVSLGLYQAYITVAICLLLLYLADGLMFRDETASNSLKTAFRFLLCGLLSGVLYFAAMQIALRLSGTTLSDYQGFSTVGNFSLSGLMLAPILCVKRFFAFFFDFSKDMNAYSLLNVLLFALLVVFFILAVARRRLFSPWYRGALLLVYFAFLPFAASALYFLSPTIDYHNLMTMGYIVFPLMFLLLYERMEELPEGLVCFKNWSVLVLTGLMVFNFIVIANISYHNLQLSYERSMGTAIRIADRIEQTEGAAECDTLAVFGALPDSEAYSLDIAPNITGSTAGYILRADDPVVNQSVLTATLNDYCGTDFTFASPQEKEALVQTGVLKEMAPWPARTSVAVSGRTVVIVMGDTSDE